MRTLPDLSYKLDDDRIIYIEIKTDLQHIILDWVESMKAGETIELTYVRNGNEYTVTVTLD